MKGEFQLEAMDRVLTAMVDEFDRAGVLNQESRAVRVRRGFTAVPGHSRFQERYSRRMMATSLYRRFEPSPSYRCFC